MGFVDRTDAIEKTKALLDKPFCILDFETVDLPDFRNGRFPEPVQIAICDHTGKELLYTLIDPSTPIADGASTVHGITKEKLAGAPTWVDLYPQLRELLHDKTVVAYNVSFEKGVVNATNMLYRKERFNIDWFCAMLCYAAFREEYGYYGDWKWHKLGDAVEHHGIKAIGAHDAMVDIKLTLDLLRIIANG